MGTSGGAERTAGDDGGALQAAGSRVKGSADWAAQSVTLVSGADLKKNPCSKSGRRDGRVIIVREENSPRIRPSTSTVKSWWNIKYRGLQGGKKQYISCFNSYGCVLRAFNTLKQFWRGCNSAHANGSVWVIIFKNSALKLTKERFLMQNIANAWDVWKPLFPTTSLSLLCFVYRATEWQVMNKKRFWWLNGAHPVSKLYYCQ